MGGELRELRLSHNHFTGEIPECLMKFIDLKHLTLNNNYLHGSIPELPAESQLVILALHRNQLTGTITESNDFNSWLCSPCMKIPLAVPLAL